MTTKFSDTQIKDVLAELPQWELIDGKLHRGLEFRDFVEAFSFMSAVALLSEKADHHPEWSNVYNRVDISLTTHEIGGISIRDITLAKAIDATLDSVVHRS